MCVFLSYFVIGVITSFLVQLDVIVLLGIAKYNSLAAHHSLTISV